MWFECKFFKFLTSSEPLGQFQTNLAQIILVESILLTVLLKSCSYPNGDYCELEKKNSSDRNENPLNHSGDASMIFF